MKKYILSILACMFCVSGAWAGDGRIEISQADMGSPPYLITNSGSYVFTENLVLVNSRNGIEVNADNVAIDMNGFTLKGNHGEGYTGIYQHPDRNNLSICNGRVVSWPGTFSFGISAYGSNNRITKIHASSNGTGIAIGLGGVISECNASNNEIGISAGHRGIVSDCSAHENTNDGIELDDDGHGNCLIVRCTASSNGGTGIDTRDGEQCVISECAASRNGGDGIATGEGSTVSKSSAEGNGARGIVVGSGSSISGCSAFENTFAGILGERGCTVADCSASENTHGIYVAEGSSVSRCSARNNASNSIVVSANCIVINSICSNRGTEGTEFAVGIRVNGSGNRIEANSVTDNLLGIGVFSTNNLIIKNSARGNVGTGTPSANYSFNGLTQTYGPIVTSGGLITNANPWANFEF